MERTFSIVVSQKTIIIKKECLFLNKHTLAVQCARGRQYFKINFTFPWKHSRICIRKTMSQNRHKTLKGPLLTCSCYYY